MNNQKNHIEPLNYNFVAMCVSLVIGSGAMVGAFTAVAIIAFKETGITATSALLLSSVCNVLSAINMGWGCTKLSKSPRVRINEFPMQSSLMVLGFILLVVGSLL